MKAPFRNTLPHSVNVGGEQIPVHAINSRTGDAGRLAHAEESIAEYVKNSGDGLSLESIATSRAVCSDICQPALSSMPNPINIISPLR